MKKVHPAARIFPPMEGQEFEGLVNDIREHGQQQPIVLFDGAILDGRNRWRACIKLKRKPKTVAWSPGSGETPTSYVISANLHRRHLDATQLATVAVEVERLFAKEAKKRQREHGGTAPGRKAKNTSPNNGTSVSTEQREPTASRQAAKAVGVSHGMVSKAKRIKEKDPELFKKMKAGEITANKAEKMAFPTARERAKKDPWVRWADLLAKVWFFVNSVKQNGGIERLAKLWPAEQRKEYKQELIEISKRFRELSEGL